MEQAANTIRCTNCGLRHKRIPTQRPCYAARFCAQCKIRHSAKEVIIKKIYIYRNNILNNFVNYFI